MVTEAMRPEDVVRLRPAWVEIDQYISPELTTRFGSVDRVVFATVPRKSELRCSWRESGIGD